MGAVENEENDGMTNEDFEKDPSAPEFTIRIISRVQCWVSEVVKGAGMSQDSVNLFARFDLIALQRSIPISRRFLLNHFSRVDQTFVRFPEKAVFLRFNSERVSQC